MSGKNTFLFVVILSLTSTAFSQRDLFSDTWVATDALGRQLPGYGECGSVREGRTVGIFYFLWLGQHGTRGPFDITELLAENPGDPKWGPSGAFHHWGRAELGYYLSDSEYVIRKHAFMLSDAGIDTLIFDVTNAFTYSKVYLKLCEVYRKLRQAGHRTPQICFLTHSGSRQTIEKLYRDFYANRLYRELWFDWKGKPLILGEPEDLAEEIRSFFTIRKCWAWTHGEDTWQWLDHSLDRYGWHESSDRPEQLSVSAAQHPVSNIGRSYQAGKQPVPNRYGLTGQEHLGLYFAEQWERALKIDPEFVFITGWNEWVAQRFIRQEGKAPGKLTGQELQTGETYFVDAYTQEYNRDIEPMEAGYSDNYYYQMISYTRRYKGVRRREVATRDYSIQIDGRFDDWKNVSPEFCDTVGDTTHRDEQGWGNTGRYINKTGRNDFVTLKAACDRQNIYFYAKTAEPVTSREDPDWMLLFIDADRNSQTGWNGYDYRINGNVTNNVQTSVEYYDRQKGWVEKSKLRYRTVQNEIEVEAPRTTLGIAGEKLSFDFHWADNIQKDGDIIEFATSGDSAPNRRFNYRFERR
ncbi:MAG: hypothetical protein U9Q07_07570 [Planctomycetota bacterium]|nr:hypothetical protein [Planctomycetota bacterium]